MNGTATRRKEKSQQVRETILEVSRRLFIEQGYGATTIRRILTEANITTGTLYHFFKDKDDILLHMAAAHLDDAVKLVESLLPEDPDPVLCYVLELSLLFSAVEKYDRIADLYLNMYRSWRVADMVCRNHGEKNRRLFERFNKGKADEWWYERSLAITGIIQNCIAERLQGGKIPAGEHLRVIFTAAFAYFHIPMARLEPAISRAGEIIRKKKAGLYGIYL